MTMFDLEILLPQNIISQSYQYIDKIITLEKKIDSIHALVQGSSYNPYHVALHLDHGVLVGGSCTCPYYNYCTHIGAVALSAMGEEGRAEPEPEPELSHEQQMENILTRLQSLKSSISEQKDKTINMVDDGKQVRKYYPKISPQYLRNSLPDVKKPLRERYRLVFTLEDYEHVRKKIIFKVVPALVYIKKDGTDGRLARYNQNKLTNIYRKEEADLLYRMLKKDPNTLDLRHIIEQFLGKSKLTLLDHKGDEVSFHEIKKIDVTFKSFGVNKEQGEYRPFLSMRFEGGYLKKMDARTVVYDWEYDVLLIRVDSTTYLYLLHDVSSISALDLVIGISKNNNQYSHVEQMVEMLKQWPHSKVQAQLPPKKLRIIHRVPDIILVLKRRTNTMYALEVDFIVKYGDREYPMSRKEKMLYQEEEEGVLAERDLEYEKTIKDYVSYLVQEDPEISLKYDYWNKIDYIDGCDMNSFILQFARDIMKADIEIRLENKEKIYVSDTVPALRVSKSGQDWFDVELSMGEEEIESVDEDWLLQGILPTARGYMVLRPEDVEKIEAFREQGMDDEGHLSVHRHHIDVIESLAEDTVDPVPDWQEMRELYRSFLSFDEYKVALPKVFHAELRPYQQTGYRWLSFLHDNNLNGCLADDMGLGKTIQTLCLLQKLKEEGDLAPSLLILPVSLIYNWENEMQRFCPGLSSVRHMGAGREKILDNLLKYDLILSSYATFRNDVSLFIERKWDYLILDEAHIIKNANSKTFKALSRVTARHKLSLTGTPVENNTMELWAQMDFLNPGLLGNTKAFKKNYARPIEEQGDVVMAQRLQKITAPFILRRKKEEVLDDLPEKEEIVYYIEMGPAQYKLYHSLKKALYKEVKKELEEKGKKKSAIGIFTALLKLRQMALFPTLVSQEYSHIPSCKFEAFQELIEDIVPEKHKVLVFSQFIKSLDYLKKYLKQEKIPFSYLDGKTKDRQAEVERFQNDPDIPVFLISLKAGGLGLNLTEADYVFLFDPWWNPAVESQAVDRAHRIGQKSKVFAYKLIVKDTVEEKILALQEKKKALVDQLISKDGAFFSAMNEEDILGLFE